MEEKERYSYDYFIDGAVFIDTENERDMDMDTVCSLLNKQDKRIKVLEEENKQLKQQLHDLHKKVVEEIRDCLLDVSNGWWRYFMTDGCEYMLSSDLQGCLDETIDTILKKYGGEDE